MRSGPEHICNDHCAHTVALEESGVWYQPRCVFCGREHYMPAVPAISHGQHPCCWCGLVPPVFGTRELYQRALAGFCCPRCQLVSASLKDVEEGYCGSCHDFTGGDIKVGQR